MFRLKLIMRVKRDENDFVSRLWVPDDTYNFELAKNVYSFAGPVPSFLLQSDPNWSKTVSDGP